MCWKKDEIKAILMNPEGQTKAASNGVMINNSFIIYKMLQSLLQRQTEDEQSSSVTKYNNGVGFNGADSYILTQIANTSAEYMRKNPKNRWGLSKGQCKTVSQRLIKYAGQLEEIASSKKAAAAPPVQVNVQLPLVEIPKQPKPVEKTLDMRVAERVTKLLREDPDTFYQGGMLDDEDAVNVWSNKFRKEYTSAATQW